MNQKDIEHILTEALETLYAENLEIVGLDVAERTICAQLSGILQRFFDLHEVHIEYNRHGIRPKAIELPDAQGILTMNLVSPDIIIHQPGHDEENILAIEVKKTTNAAPDHADIAKLAQIKQQIGYRFAVFLRLPAGPAADPRDIRIVWV
jgi:hypothetical protein